MARLYCVTVPLKASDLFDMMERAQEKKKIIGGCYSLPHFSAGHPAACCCSGVIFFKNGIF